MFARVSYARFPPEHYDAGWRVVVEQLLPALRRASGYRGCYLLADGKPGTGLAVVLWETEEDADAASTNRAVARAHVALAALGLAIESRKIYQVVVQDPCCHRDTGPVGEPTLSPSPIGGFGR